MTGRTTTTARAASAAAIALAAAAGLAACSGKAQGEEAGTSSPGAAAPTAASSASVATSAPAASSASAGASGTWTGTGDYRTPGGTESVTVTLTAKDGVVSAVTVKGSGGSPNSQRYQSAFISGVSGEVVGKQLSTLEVGAVSGSSLTGKGFNAAVDEIRADAA